MSDMVHVEVAGEGHDIVLVHGWGLHGGIWDRLSEHLSRRHRVLRVDLPGHGHSALSRGDYSINLLAKSLSGALSTRLSGEAVWLGWSLGGLVSLAVAASQPALVRALMLVGATPRFTSAPDWPFGVEPSVLDEFAVALGRDYRGTLMQFLTLQTLHSEHARDEVRYLRNEVFARGEPHPDALRGGVNVLKNADLRTQLSALACPLYLLGGERDTLASPRALHQTAKLAPKAEVAILKGAGHAPFLSDPDAFHTRVDAWLADVWS